MPRKRSEFNTGIYNFKKWNSVDSVKLPGSNGSYPSNRQFGTSIQRTVIEQWNLDSDWVKWRKGFEIYNRTAWSTLKVKNENYDPGLEETASNKSFLDAVINSTLYKGTPYEISNVFTGYEYPTMKADTNTYYVVKRVPEYKPLGTITAIQNDSALYSDNYLNREICVSITPNPTNGRLLLQMIGERIADGEYTDNNRTEATLKRIQTSDNKPLIYRGKTLSRDLENTVAFTQKATEIKISIPISDVTIHENSDSFIPNQGINNQVRETQDQLDILNNPELLVNKIIYLNNFFIDKPIADMTQATFKDDDYYFEVSIKETENNQELVALNQGVNELPPSMLDVINLPKIFSTTNATYTIEGSFIFNKASYQKYFGSKYLTADVVESEVNDISYSIIPFIINKADIINGQLIIESLPFLSQIKLYGELVEGTKLIFSDTSFCKTTTSNTKWTDINTDIDPWIDEIFTTALPLRPSVTYSCSCPNYSHALLAMPQAGEDSNKRKTNRQNRYPLPTALSPNQYDIIGIEKSAGKLTSWETESHRLSFKQCKHTIASMFNDDVRVREPNKYPTQINNLDADSVNTFEEKLIQDIINSANAYNLSYKRTGISISEIVFAMASGLNLDTIETAYFVSDSK